MNIFLYVLFGIIGGIFGGLGMGGGTLLIPLLTIFLNLDQKMCQGINLISFLVMALISILIHYKHGYIKLNGIPYIIISGILFSILGAFLVNYLSTFVLRIIFGVFLIFLALIEFLKILSKKN